jgi:hypothetical protein
MMMPVRVIWMDRKWRDNYRSGQVVFEFGAENHDDDVDVDVMILMISWNFALVWAHRYDCRSSHIMLLELPRMK